MTFIHNNVLPVKLAKCRFIVQDVLICSQNDVEFLISEEIGQGWSLVLLALIGDHFDGWSPLCELIDPVLDCH